MSEQQKWTDERIEQVVENVNLRRDMISEFERSQTVKLVQQIRNDMQAEIDTLRRQNETLQHQLAELAKLAITPGSWQPVEDGQWQHEIITKQNELGEAQLIIEGGQIIHIQTTDEGVSFVLEDGVRLCQRVEPEWLDHPTGPGWWAFDGYYDWSDGVVVEHENLKDTFRVVSVSGNLYANDTNRATWLVQHMIGKWHRLDIQWPGEGES